MVKIILASDHAGFELKEVVKAILSKKRHSVIDISPELIEGDDYPDSAVPAARQIARSKSLGIFFCGSGAGVCMSANKVNGVRAALAYDIRSAVEAREDDNANVLCLGGRRTKPKDAIKIVERWLAAKPKNGRFIRREKKLDKLGSK